MVWYEIINKQTKLAPVRVNARHWVANKKVNQHDAHTETPKKLQRQLLYNGMSHDKSPEVGIDISLAYFVYIPKIYCVMVEGDILSLSWCFGSDVGVNR